MGSVPVFPVFSCFSKKVLDKGELIYYVRYNSRRFIFDSVPLRLFKDSDKGKPRAIGGHKATGHIQNLDEIGC